MQNFLNDDIYLTNSIARELYAQVKNLPIYDYHCHLDPREIYENRRFDDIGTLWLEADHYKWYITGRISNSKSISA